MNKEKLRRRLVTLAKMFCVLVVLFILLDLEENVRGWIGLHLYLRQLRAQREKLTLAELDLPGPPKDGNGAAPLPAAAVGNMPVADRP